ncbi:MAG: PQQ-binding-like beta-propeller repeat protein [Prosthecobacter sp.]
MKTAPFRFALILLAAAAPALAADWPMWRHDARRSAVTAEVLPEKLALEWSRDLGMPDPAFDYHFRLCADEANEPVAAGGLLFVPSNTRHSVTAYDLSSGEERWCFITEGPVRFAPVVEAGVVFFGSDDGHVYAVEAASGAVKWKTRAAPADRADHRMLVNGRMSSRWPVRGGPVISNGILYAGCGVWPAEGVFLVAFDAATGAVKWRNADISQIDDGLEEHGQMADMGLPPHGYLAMLAGRVAMPSGRALAAFAEPTTGKLDPYNSFYAKVYPVPRGSWALTGNADYWFQGGAVMGTSPEMLERLPAGPVTEEEFARMARKDLAWVRDMKRRKFIQGDEGMVKVDLRDPKVGLFINTKSQSSAQLFQIAERPVLNMAQIGTRHEVGERGMPIFTETRMYRSEFADPKGVEVERGMTRVAVPKYDKLRGYKLDEAFWKLNLMPSKQGQPVQRNLEFPIEWELDVPQLTVKLLAGNRLYLAGENKVAAVTLDEKPSIDWQAKVDGYPASIIAADGKLIVSTNRGKLHVFGAAAPRSIAEEKPAAWERQPAWRGQVARIKTGLSGGYALVLGWNSGELAKELALQTKLHVIVAEPDAAVAAQAREAMRHAGRWAERLHILTGTSSVMKLPPYFAEVVLSESLAKLDEGARLWTRQALQCLRPHTGMALLPLRPQLIEQAKAHAEAIGGGFEFSMQKNLSIIHRRQAPKGADDWTHESASPANTFASRDTLAVPPFGLLWYSGGIDREFSPEFEYHHNRNPYPVISGGRLFMLAANEVHAVDAYTGRHLWQREMPVSPMTERRLADHRTHQRPVDQNLIATADRLYVFTEQAAHGFDPATGDALPVIEVPGAPVWDEVRMEGEMLFISAGKKLHALDRRSGKQAWERSSEQDHTAFGIGDGRLFVVDYTTDRARSGDKAGAYETRLTMLDAKTGESFWSEPLSAPAHPGQSEASAGKPKWSGIFIENPLKPTLHFNTAHGVVLAIVDRHQFHAFNAASGSRLWQHDSGARLTDLVTFEPPTVTSDLVICDNGTVLDVSTGKPAGPQQVGGRGTGCNRFVGSDALVTFRSALACYLDLEKNERTYLSSTRPGCTNSMIPAAGLLNAPNFAHGCVCNYPFLTSFALFHLPEAAKWAPKQKPDVQLQRNPNKD